MKYLFNKTLILVCTLFCALLSMACNDDEQQTEITGMMMNTNKVKLAIGEELQLTATARPGDIDFVFTWTSSDETVAKVDSRGKVVGVGYGSAVITARYKSYSAKCEVDYI